ncbi:squalene monooxygenase isoform X1 [Latimeria chalumnae]|uniref:squalene monooxygenase isoform X1 n=1 Tax=Latimeria chalumnae TaxID=7897 RepID=UPI00313DB6F1
MCLNPALEEAPLEGEGVVHSPCPLQSLACLLRLPSRVPAVMVVFCDVDTCPQGTELRPHRLISHIPTTDCFLIAPVSNPLMPAFPFLFVERIKAVFLETIQTQRMRGTPVGVVKASILKKPGVLLLGDSYNVRNPVVASGMSIALIDLKLWRDLLWAIPDLKDDKAMLQAKKKFHWSRKSSHSIVINVLAQFFYVIFTATGGYIFHLRQGYLDYLKSGKCGLEMAGMISVLATNPKLLAVHFRAAALHAVCLFFKTEPWYLKPRAAFHSCAFLFRNFAVFFPVLYSELW